MSRAGFYSDNEFRAYPFVKDSGAFVLSNKAIVDFGCTMRANSGFVPGTHKVWLYQITKVSDDYTFHFKCDAPGLVGKSLVFRFRTGDPEYATQFSNEIVSEEYLTQSQVEGYCNDDVKWEGFMVIGKLTYADLSFIPTTILTWKTVYDGLLHKSGENFILYADAAPDGESVADNTKGIYVEPALIQNLSDGYVRTINVANRSRTVVTNVAGCDNVDPVDDLVYVQSECLFGDVKIKPGFNCTLRLNPNDNSMTIGGEVGAGEGEPCSEFKFYPEEVSPDGGLFYTGGPACKEILQSINGVSGKVVRIVGGQGVEVKPGNDAHTIIISGDSHGLAGCPA